MPKAPLLAFNRGEVSRTALARVDLAKLQLAAQCQLNFMPSVVGPAMLRPGLRYVGGTASDHAAALIDFVYGKSDTALLELTDSLLRVWIDDTLLTRPSVSTAVSDGTFAGGGTWSTADTTAGCTATITGGLATLTATARGGLARIKQAISVAGGDQNVEHGLRIVVERGPVTLRAGSAMGLSDYLPQTVLDTGTHSLSVTPTGGTLNLQIESNDARAKRLSSVSIEAAGTVTLPTPWAAAALASLRWCQSKDVVYVGQYGGIQYKIERRGTRPHARGFSVVRYRSNSGPFFELPTIDANLTPDCYEGNGNLTSDRPVFQSGHVGALFRLFINGQANQCVLGAAGAFTDPIRVTGIGNDRKFGVHVSGTYVGVLSIQRSLVGPDSGFAPVTQGTSGGTGTIDIDDSSTLNNVVAWYRVGFALAADYTSGAATVFFGQLSAGSATPSGSPTQGAAASTGGRYGIARVTGYTSPTSVAIEVLAPFPALAPTKSWQEGVWSDVQGYPQVPLLQEGRLWWFGGALPIAGSEASDFIGFAQADAFGGTLGDAGAIVEDFGEGPADRVNFALPLARILIGREQSVESARSSALDAPLTPTNFVAKTCSGQGAGRLPAVKIGVRGVFVSASGAKVYELAPNPQVGDYGDRDLTRLNLDIGKPGFVDVARAVQPDGMIYLPRSDGQLAALLYDPNDEVEAWWRIQTLGVVETVRVLPNPSGADDLVYVVVKRTVNGSTKRFIEKLAQRSECVGASLNRQLDSHVVYSGSPATTVTLAHLPSTTVAVWADGAYIGTGTTDGSGVLTLPDAASHSNIVAGLAGARVSYSGAAATGMSGLSAYNGIPGEFFADQQPSGRMRHVGTLTPSGGAVTLPNGWQATSIVGFFGFMAPFMSAKLGYAAQGGAPLTHIKQIAHLGLVLFDAGAAALSIGQRFDALDAMPAYEAGAAVPSGTVWSQYDEPVITVPGEWDTDARLCLLGAAPNPVTLGAVVVDLDA